MKPLLITSVACLAIAISIALGVSFSKDNEVSDGGIAYKKANDNLPSVLAAHQADLIESTLRNEAVFRYGLHRLPAIREAWQKERTTLRKEIIQKAGLVIDAL